MHQGRAYVFELELDDDDDGSVSWSEVANLTASDGEGLDRFGYSVSIADGRAPASVTVGSSPPRAARAIGRPAAPAKRHYRG